MVSVLASCVVDSGFEPRSGQTKDYKIGICCFSAKHTALKRRSKDRLTQNQDNVSVWGDMSTCRLLFQWASSIKNPTKHGSLVQIHLVPARFLQVTISYEFVYISEYQFVEFWGKIVFSLIRKFVDLLTDIVITGVKLMTITVITVIPRWRTWNRLRIFFGD